MWNEGSAGHYMPPHVRGFMALQHICIGGLCYSHWGRWSALKVVAGNRKNFSYGQHSGNMLVGCPQTRVLVGVCLMARGLHLGADQGGYLSMSAHRPPLSAISLFSATSQRSCTVAIRPVQPLKCVFPPVPY